MPVYEYKCELCKAILADLVSWREVKEAGSTCLPRQCYKDGCGGQMHRIISVPARPYIKV